MRARRSRVYKKASIRRDIVPAAKAEVAHRHLNDNVLSWLALRESSQNFFLLRYEEMKKDTAKELGDVELGSVN